MRGPRAVRPRIKNPNQKKDAGNQPVPGLGVVGMNSEALKHTRITHRPIPAVSVLTNSRYVLTYVGHDNVGPHSQLGLKRNN